MSVHRLTITKGQLAEKFGITDRTLDKKLPALVAAGFPRKLPGMNVWSEPAVDAWFRTWDTPAPIDPTNILELEEARSELERDYA